MSDLLFQLHSAYVAASALLKDNESLSSENAKLRDELQSQQNLFPVDAPTRFDNILLYLSRNSTGDLIRAIKEMRAIIPGLGLKEAKWMCERLRDKLHYENDGLPF
jgi:ribosomal protein L7/L12